MAKISDIRRSNLLRLRSLCELKYSRDKKDDQKPFNNIIFSNQIGITSVEFSQLKNHKLKPYFNEIYARKIERHADLELGWFDVNRDNVELEAIRTNFDLFEKGVIAYNNFVNLNVIEITDKNKRKLVLKNLYLFLYNQSNLKTIEVTESDFFDFMKTESKL